MNPLICAITVAATLLLIGSAAAEISARLDYDSMKLSVRELEEAMNRQDDIATSTAIRKLVKSLPSENLKFIGLDVKNWSLKSGTMTYYDGKTYELTAAPFWPKVKDYAHYVHDPDSRPGEIGYIVSGTNITPDSGRITRLRSRAIGADNVTPVYVFGHGPVSTKGHAASKETCSKLRAQQDKLAQFIDDVDDSEAFIVVTADMYCPQLLKHLKGYKELSLLSGYLGDGTKIEYEPVGSLAEAEGEDGTDPPPSRAARKLFPDARQDF